MAVLWLFAGYSGYFCV